MNKIILFGRLGADPELRTTKNNNFVTSFSMATDRHIKGEKKTTWHDVTCWQKLAENVAKYLKKGDECLVEGLLEEQSWENQDGQKRHKKYVLAESVRFTSAKHNNLNDGNTQHELSIGYQHAEQVPSLDEIPF